MTNPLAEQAAKEIEANIKKIAYAGYTEIQGGQIRREITTIIDQAITTAIENETDGKTLVDNKVLSLMNWGLAGAEASIAELDETE